MNFQWLEPHHTQNQLHQDPELTVFFKRLLFDTVFFSLCFNFCWFFMSVNFFSSWKSFQHFQSYSSKLQMAEASSNAFDLIFLCSRFCRVKSKWERIVLIFGCNLTDLYDDEHDLMFKRLFLGSDLWPRTEEVSPLFWLCSAIILILMILIVIITHIAERPFNAITSVRVSSLFGWGIRMWNRFRVSESRVSEKKNREMNKHG